MRPIDADAFEQELKEKLLPLLVEKYGKEEAMKGLHFSLHDCISNIQGQPTITQPEIIRCKDCKHFAGEGMYCSCDIIVQFDHFYCYHAERRQDV